MMNVKSMEEYNYDNHYYLTINANKKINSLLGVKLIKGLEMTLRYRISQVTSVTSGSAL